MYIINISAGDLTSTTTEQDRYLISPIFDPMETTCFVFMVSSSYYGYFQASVINSNSQVKNTTGRIYVGYTSRKKLTLEVSKSIETRYRLYLSGYTSSYSFQNYQAGVVVQSVNRTEGRCQHLGNQFQDSLSNDCKFDSFVTVLFQTKLLLSTRPPCLLCCF